MSNSPYSFALSGSLPRRDWMGHSIEELQKLIVDVESDVISRQDFWEGNAPDTLRQAVCAFANDLPYRNCEGVLFVGVADNGTPTGLAITDELLRTLADIRTVGKNHAHNQLAVDYVSAPRETRTSLYPLAAFQQLFRNAVMPRTYEHTK